MKHCTSGGLRLASLIAYLKPIKTEGALVIKSKIEIQWPYLEFFSLLAFFRCAFSAP